jgi:hypothetical protein
MFSISGAKGSIYHHKPRKHFFVTLQSSKKDLNRGWMRTQIFYSSDECDDNCATLPGHLT